MSVNNLKISTQSEFDKFIKDHKQGYIFRSEWKDYGDTQCTPKLGRLDKNNPKRINEYDNYEKLICRYIERMPKYVNDLFSKNTKSDIKFGAGKWLSIFQHHGFETRFLDWTSDLDVALLFLINGWKKSDDKISEALKQSGFIFAIKLDQIQQQEREIRERIRPGQGYCEKGFNTDYYKYFLENKLEESLLFSVDTHGVSNPRQEVQNSIFTVSNKLDKLENILPESVDMLKIEVTSEIKEYIVSGQDKMNYKKLLDPLTEIINEFQKNNRLLKY
ncbi:FRG domain-containing protein [Candidatus Thiodiazotropha sp. CDECU1]|uniref:FRG domain-containing protein n=1 Tax=Candidatus Thiodiazotropha sp. CDECU1 TaxID=3065865 RepID=UPI00292CB5A7|nr:FRG domain-containing protein [Candidatus Thiodiazotropha sp. CDECU1]